MVKKNLSTQELVNLFPEWTQIRSDDQSVGAQFFNALASPLDRMDQQLAAMEKNAFLTTANIDDIDVIATVQLPQNYTFAQDSTDPLAPVPIAPTVSGLVITSPTISGWHTVTLTNTNELQDFWYNSLPNRLTAGLTVTGVDLLIDQNATLFPYSGELLHHLGGGRLHVEALSGVQYLTKNQFNTIDRGTVIINGVTRKGLLETETLVFPWNMKQPSLKEWTKITSVEAYHMEDTVQIKMTSSDCDRGPYLSFWNLRYGESRPKVDEFWNLGTTISGSSLDRIGYIADEWQQLVLGLSDKEVKRSWELLDSNGAPVDYVDMAVQPFTNRAWMVTDSGGLACYDLTENMISGVSFLQPQDIGAEIDIECNRYVVIGETIEIIPWHARPFKQVDSWRLSYQDPAGNKYLLRDDGTVVAFDNTVWDYGDTLLRYLGRTLFLTADQRGEYVFTLEANFVDSSSEKRIVIVKVDSKLPLVQLDASGLISGTIVGIDFDSDQTMWLKNDSDVFFQVMPHTDNMLIDFTGKIIYLHELYDQIKIT